jgi:voltage-dependent calcium channel alpha-2/delta-3
MVGARRAFAALGVLALIVGFAGSQSQEHKIDGEVVNMWGSKFGKELWESLTVATRRDTIQQGYNDHSEIRVEKIDGLTMVRKMAIEVQIMMQHKIDAIKRIMELAENIALDHKYDKDRGERLKEGRYTYYNAKKLNVLPEGEEEGANEYERYLSQYRDQNDEYWAPGYSRMVLTANKHFSGIPVNISYSSVHVPTNVYDGEPKVINAIDWSKKLDDTFKDNYQRDPSLSWQFFGSSTGFLRQYPAMKWLMYEDDPDMYDARMRDWYIKSAASPKDIVILLDVSGSMTGLRKEIAKHVVLNIMETLGEDDFVTVLTFSDETKPLVECFTDSDGEPELVQATTENIAEFTEAVNEIETMEIANFTSALTAAFTLLERYRTKKFGAESNQAIMLVTDGVPYTYENIFQEYNQPHKPVRVFTYLIGREISDLDAAKWMACENKGYFTHVTTLAEVKEQVLKTFQ